MAWKKDTRLGPDDDESEESADYSEAVKGIRRGLEDVARDRTKPAAQVFAEIREKHGNPKSVRK